MLKQQEIDSLASCLNSADAAEPIFVLRAHDEVAPETVRAWAGAYLASKRGWENADARQRAKYMEAMKLAAAMENYARKQGWRR